MTTLEWVLLATFTVQSAFIQWLITDHFRRVNKICDDFKSSLLKDTKQTLTVIHKHENPWVLETSDVSQHDA